MATTAVLSTDPLVLARDESGDIIVPLRLARGMEAVLILVRAALRLFRDEWFLDRDEGTEWLPTLDGVVPERDAILGQPYDAAKIVRVVRRVILGRPGRLPIPGVIDVVELKSSFAGESRELSLQFVVRTRFGDSDPQTVAIGV